MLQIGDKVKEVKVINFDPETNKISAGMKQLVYSSAGKHRN